MNNKAFTLVEIAVTAVILVVLGLVAVTNITDMADSGYTQNAMSNLLSIYATQQKYYQSNNKTYLPNCNLSCINGTLGANVKTNNKFTTYSCTSTICKASTATVSNGLEMSIDLSKSVTESLPMSCDLSSGVINYDTYNPCGVKYDSGGSLINAAASGVRFP